MSVNEQPLDLNINSSSISNNLGENITIDSDNKSVLDEPLNKKQKMNENINVDKKLEDRLGSLLLCCVCLDGSKMSIYQCSNGHLMCAACFTHILTDARLKDDGPATCPNCRCEISRQLCCRSLVAEKVLSQLPIECNHCKQVFLRCDIETHEKSECNERPTKCIYNRIGCHWEGPFHELSNHIDNCFKITHPFKNSKDILESLKEKEISLENEKQSLLSVINVFSFEKVCFNDLQFKPYKTDEITPKLYFETSRFTAFFHQWVIKARINDNQKDPNLTVNRYLSYQLILKSKLSSSTLDVKFFVLKGPFNVDINIIPKAQNFEFSSTKSETDYIRLNLESSLDCNKLLASKFINFRFWMFQI